MRPLKYHPLLIALHWILAVLVLGHLALGGLVLEALPNDDGKMFPLAMHMGVGILIGILVFVRLATRFSTTLPARPEGGSRKMDRVGLLNHFLLYLFVLAMVSTGIGTAVISGALESVLSWDASLLPESFEAFPPMKGHGLFATILLLLIALHIAAALYHQFSLKDGLIDRMRFKGPRWPARDAGHE